MLGFVAEKWRLILFGRYPYGDQWRPALATVVIVAMLAATAWPGGWTRRGARALIAGWALALGAFFGLMGGGWFGLESVGSERWGGLTVTVILTLDRHRCLHTDRHRPRARTARTSSHCCARWAVWPTSSSCAACR